MKKFINLMLVFVLSGCTAVTQNIAIDGVYITDMQQESTTETKGLSTPLQTRKYTLMLYPNGRYVASFILFYGGQAARNLSLVCYDFQTASSGTWVMVGNHIALKSDGRFTAWQDVSRRPKGHDEGMLTIISKNDGRTLVWNGVEYKFSEKMPNQAIEPTTPGVTPAADAPVAPPGVVAHLER